MSPSVSRRWHRRRRRASARAPVELPAVVVAKLRSGVVVLDAADDVALSNPAAREMGLVRGDRVVYRELRDRAASVRHSGESVAELALPCGGPLGYDTAIMRVRGVPTYRDRVVLLIEDVTDSHRLEAVRRDFVANVSHELKTPVGALGLLTDTLAEAADDPEAVQHFATRMRQEADRLTRLVQDLVDLSRLEGADAPPPSRTVAVDRVIAEAVDRVRLAAEGAGITVAIEGIDGVEGTDDLSVRGDEQQLVTALGNLLSNAINYSPVDRQVRVRVRRYDGALDIAVADEGIGIAEHDLERVFERFYRADPARSRATGGTGLGLAIVKHVVGNHGGSVRVSSVEGVGSTFTLRLPSYPPIAPVSDDPAAAPSRAAPGSRR